MTDNHDDELTRYSNRITTIISAAVNGLNAEDRAQRIAHCQQHNQHGVRLHTTEQDDILEFRWGGKPLALIRRDDLFGEDVVLAAEFMPEIPDTIPDDI